MSVSIIVGGQYGSEGKGKVADFWSKKMNAAAVVRVGGPNSGHTVYTPNGERIALQQLPTACVQNDVKCILSAGTYIDLKTLQHEIQKVQISPNRLMIDTNAVIIDSACHQTEIDLHLRERIGSTLSGTGDAVAQRVLRGDNVVLAKHVSSLSPFIGDTKKFLHSLIEAKKHVVIEGTQGYGLSLLHSDCYPYATSRDTTAASFLSETGLSPFDVEHIVMVLRAFPIRVAGNSGPLSNEITWEQLTEESESSEKIYEYTTVTHKVRRVARFDPELVKKAISVNKPNIIVLNHADYFDMSQQGKSELSPRQTDAISSIADSIGRQIDYIGNGPNTIIDISKSPCHPLS